MKRMCYSFTTYGNKLVFQCDNEAIFEEAKGFIERLLESEAYRGMPMKVTFVPDEDDSIANEY